MHPVRLLALAAVMLVLVACARADIVEVWPSDILTTETASGTAWRYGAGNSPSPDPQSVRLTTTQPRSGVGSLEFTGDDVTDVGMLVFAGVSAAGQTQSLGSFGTLGALSFDWWLAPGVSPADAAVPTVQIDLADSARARYPATLVWEYEHNRLPSAASGWQHVDLRSNDALFWVRNSGHDFDIDAGRMSLNAHLDRLDPILDGGFTSVLLYAGTTQITGFRIGFGPNWAGSTHMFADNVTLGFGSTETTYNFEGASPIPEPAYYQMSAFLFGGGLLAWRTRRRTGR